MDANVIIENLLERIKGLTKENAFLQAQLIQVEEDMKKNGEGNNAE